MHKTYEEYTQNENTYKTKIELKINLEVSWMAEDGEDWIGL